MCCLDLLLTALLFENPTTKTYICQHLICSNQCLSVGNNSAYCYN
jgi:hypothetical protein